jgi:streptogramin lyase
MPGDGMGMGDVEKSFLWVANTDESSIAKVDTQTMKELARYRSGPGFEDPSRTAVSVDGRFVVVNNRETGRVTAIAADPEDCKDLNNNGMIDTSTSPNDLRAWGQEECTLWSIVLPYDGENGAGPRGVTWTPGDWDQDSCSFINPKVWVGYRPSWGVAHMAKLNGGTGAIEQTVELNNWSVGDNWWGPYGAALDSKEQVWFTGLRGNLYKIETKNNNALKEYTSPGDSQFYGMTVDAKGRAWTAGCAGPVYRFDPMTESFAAVPGTNDCFRGIGADKEGFIWTAMNFECAVMQIDADSATVVQVHQLNPCSTPVGISVDLEGFVWVVDEWEGAWKIDPLNPNAKQFVPIANQHYTYSDMTGGQIKSAILPQ